MHLCDWQASICLYVLQRSLQNANPPHLPNYGLDSHFVIFMTVFCLLVFALLCFYMKRTKRKQNLLKMQLYKYYSLLICFSDSARNHLEHSVSILGFTFFFTPITHKETDLWFLDYCLPRSQMEAL